MRFRRSNREKTLKQPPSPLPPQTGKFHLKKNSFKLEFPNKNCQFLLAESERNILKEERIDFKNCAKLDDDFRL